ncbi:membrane protein [Marvinbryantia formatexigens DSM 14469]|uniref:Membrane protein n=1 Tax=Marvinbryantia formatexigens DSM 14469 TaxID=478749 RepID=C6LGP7_9FIRM|nr:stage II sporulation protein M [Marvinbryantia formatexigens]EET60247.1 membrane protein [Marvinbryantia formatexigens DSM 14469]UWO24270.1 stage II sporulation protein M [Marvinbryantia formatexigens DSM 14469]SDF56726.1 Stage II sporulation protein M [Marvinbryantia formatexigens]
MKKQNWKDLVIAGIFFLGFLAGSLFVNLWGNTYLKENEILNESTLLSIKNTEIDQQALFFHILLQRGKVFLFLGLIGCTAAGIPVVLAALGWIGFAAGMFLGIFVVRMHMLGILLFLASILPQAFVYAPLIWILAKAVMERGIDRFRGRKRPELYTGEKTYLRDMCLCAALFLVGVLLESSAGPWLLKQAVKYFF